MMEALRDITIFLALPATTKYWFPSMDIIKEITEKINSFTRVTGKKPSCVYLGKDEALLLAQWVKDYVYGDDAIGNPLTDWVGRRRPELFGINVYVVNEDRHLACS